MEKKTVIIIVSVVLFVIACIIAGVVAYIELGGSGSSTPLTTTAFPMTTTTYPPPVTTTLPPFTTTPAVITPPPTTPMTTFAGGFPAYSGYSFTPASDGQGADLGGFIGNPMQCVTACNANPQCMGFASVNAGYNAGWPNQGCAMKSAIVPVPGANSGIGLYSKTTH